MRVFISLIPAELEPHQAAACKVAHKIGFKPELREDDARSHAVMQDARGELDRPAVHFDDEPVAAARAVAQEPRLGPAPAYRARPSHAAVQTWRHGYEKDTDGFDIAVIGLLLFSGRM